MLEDAMDQKYTDEQQADIRQAMAYLNKNQFYYMGTRSAPGVRNALVNPHTRAFVKSAFAVMGHEFVSDESEGWWGIIPDPDLVDARSMTKVDTLVVLIAASVYAKRFSEGEIDARANAQTSLNSFCDTVEMYVNEAGMNEVKPAAVRASLAKLQFMSVVEIGKDESSPGDNSLLIRPFVSRLVGLDALARLDDYIDRNKSGSERGAGVDDGIPSTDADGDYDAEGEEA
jgi:hypothetical protein